MSALLGFTGPPDPSLRKEMEGQLRHRSAPGKRALTYESASSTLVVLPSPVRHPSADLEAGIHTLSSNERLATSGIITACLQRPLSNHPRELAQNLRGAFVAAVTHGSSLSLLRDATGRRTIYCGRVGHRWLFGIEPKAIHRIRGFDRRLRPGAVAQYLTFSFIPGRQTMLEGLWEVPAGYLARLLPSESEPIFEPVYLPELQAGHPSRPEEAWVERFRVDFAKAVRRLRPDNEPIAVFLSGGIDSSIVTAQLAEEIRPASIHTFAVHFGDRYPSERVWARMVAEHVGTTHHEIQVTPKDFVPRLQSVVQYLDEPIGDPVAMPNFELAARVRERGFHFVFNGEGGDPLFGGPKNLPMLLHHWYGGNFGADFRERAYLASYQRALEELDPLLTPELRSQIDPERDLVSVLRPFFATDKPARFLDKLLAINIRLKGAHLILPKVERMLGAWELTPLSPLFDEELLELTFQLPGALKLHHGVEKVVLKRAFADRLPAAIIDRPKSGMRVPVHHWLQRDMRRYARSLLSPKRIEADGLFRARRVQDLLDYRPVERAGRFGLRLWMLITFQIWKEQVLGR